MKRNAASPPGAPGSSETGTESGAPPEGQLVAETQGAPVAEPTGADPDVTRLVANLTHELKTPLHSILAVANVLASEVDGPLNDEQKRQVSIINRNAERLLELIVELLQYTSITTETRSLRLRRIPVKRCFEQLVSTIAPVAAQSGVQVDTDFTKLPSHAVSDESLLNRIFGNLLSNAVKFSPNGGVVSFFAEGTRDGGLRAQVADSGIGISPEAQETIFKEFYQVEAGDSRRFGGVGLGLALVKSSVERLKGTIELRSERGRGTLFTVDLPPLTEDWRPPQILVVTDDPTTRLTLEECFRVEGFGGVFSDSGEDVVGRIAGSDPDLVILDLVPPEMRAFDQLRAVRGSGLSKELPVMLVSALDAPAERAKGFELGANDFLVKPFDVAELLARVRGQLERAR